MDKKANKEGESEKHWKHCEKHWEKCWEEHKEIGVDTRK